MGKDSFMLVSLKEDKAKKLAQVLSNPTSTKILDYLTKGDATETEVSKKLKIPLSTVHYNLKQLVEAKLVVVEEFHYSPKGKEVNHYKLANKYIIIAPDETEGLFDKLKKFVPVAVITVGAAVILKGMQLFTGTAFTKSEGLSAPQADLSRAISPLEPAPTMQMTDDVGVKAMDPAEKAVLEDVLTDAATEEAVSGAGLGGSSTQSVALVEDAETKVADAVSGAAIPEPGSGAAATSGGSRTESARPAVEGFVDETANETVVDVVADATNEAVSETVNEIAQEITREAVTGPAVIYTVPWWQSAVVDWLILGALSVLLVLVLIEIFRHYRSKR